MQKKFANQSSAADREAGSSSHNQDSRAVAPSITFEQYNQLINLLQQGNLNQPTTYSNQVYSLPPIVSFNDNHHSTLSYSYSCHNFILDSWIIDSGASDHMCGSLKWFQSY